MRSALNAGESAICPAPARPSAEIVRVECAKCRRECDLSGARGTLCGDRACRVREMQARVRFVRFRRNPLRRSCVSSVRNAGESAKCPVRAQPSAEIARVECAKCRRECDLSGARGTLCGDRACRVREMQARVRFVRFRAQPSAEIVRVECAKCRRECEVSGPRATLCGDRACRVREMQARVRFVRFRRNPLRRVREMQARVRSVQSAHNPLRRSCVSSARNASQSAICPVPAQPFAEIVRVECAKCRRECVLETCRFTFGGSLVRNARCGDLPLHFWRKKSRAKTLVLETCRCMFGGSLARNARFGDLALHFWQEPRTKRSFWRLAASLYEEVSYEMSLGAALVELDSDKCSAGRSFSELDSEVASL